MIQIDSESRNPVLTSYSKGTPLSERPDRNQLIDPLNQTTFSCHKLPVQHLGAVTPACSLPDYS